MKKVSITLVSVFLCLVVNAQEKTPGRFGLKTGLNASIFNASINSESSFRTGFHLGMFVRFQTSKNISVTPELYYSAQGQKDEYYIPPNGPSRGSTTTRMNYLNIPFVISAGKKVRFQFIVSRVCFQFIFLAACF